MQTTISALAGSPNPTTLDADAALRRLYAGNAAALRAYVRRYTTDAQADDIVQETFIRAWRHLDRLERDDRPVRPWLIQVARHLLTDAARHDRRRPPTVADEHAAATVGVDGGLDRVLDQQVLQQAIKRLPPRQLSVFIESWVCGASLDAVAERLGIPPGTARSRMHYALRILRAQLAPTEQVAR
jgi:RNA polymerase sigma-70 factor (ECF subfamily)